MFNVTVLKMKDIIKYLVGIIITIIFVIYTARYFSSTKIKTKEAEKKQSKIEIFQFGSLTSCLSKTIPTMSYINEEYNGEEQEKQNEEETNYLEEFLRTEISSIKGIEKIEKYDKTHKIAGIEIASKDFETMKKAVEFSIKHNYIFQCHAPKISTNEELLEYLSNVGKLAKILNKKINIVFHSKEDDNLKIAKLNTINLLNTIFNYIKENNLNISISLENLNYHHNHDRINVDKIDSILSEFDDVNFTYDIGHDIFDNHNYTKLSKLQLKKLNNIHIHNVCNNKDHCEITPTCDYITQLRDSVKYLKSINYEKSIVLETGFNNYPGNNYEEKLINYIKSFEKIEDILKTE